MGWVGCRAVAEADQLPYQTLPAAPTAARLMHVELSVRRHILILASPPYICNSILHSRDLTSEKKGSSTVARGLRETRIGGADGEPSSR